MVSDKAVAVLGVLAIGGAVAAAYFLSRPRTPPVLMAREVSSSGGWHNEEVVDVIRNDDGFIEKLVVHRKVEAD